MAGATKDPMPPHRLRILHVEDNFRTRDIVRVALEGEMDVASVSTVADAQKKLADEGSYDVLLADLNLPDASGVQAIEVLQKYGLPIVVLTASNDMELLEQAAVSGAADFVEILDKDYLLRRLRFVCTKSAAVEAEVAAIAIEAAAAAVEAAAVAATAVDTAAKAVATAAALAATAVEAVVVRASSKAPFKQKMEILAFERLKPFISYGPTVPPFVT